MIKEDEEDDLPLSDSLSMFGAMPSEHGKKSSLHSSLLDMLRSPERVHTETSLNSS